MDRREFLRTMGVGAASLAASKAFAMPYVNLGLTENGDPPNILFILTDQWRFDALRAYGNQYMHTPNIDGLCSQGVRFDRAYVAQAVCSPSRASIISGLYPHSHLVQDNYSAADATTDPTCNLGVTWPKLLRQAGYYTGYIGKWHLGTSAPACFDEWYGWNTGLSHWMGTAYASQYRSDYETDQGLSFLDRNKSKRFVLFQSYYPPHTPYTAPQQYWQYYQGTPLSPMEYYAACSNLDWNVGRLLAKLQALNLLDRTLVIFTSDHGEHFGLRPGGANKRAAYDEAARVPCVLRYPGVFQGGQVRQDLISNVDLMPTILELAKVQAPARLHGRSLVPLMKSAGDGGRTAVVIENREDIQDSSNKASSRGVRVDTGKLILRDQLSIRATTLREYYDLAADPGEKTNVFGAAKAGHMHSSIVSLENWAQKTGDSVGLSLVRACRTNLDTSG